MGKVEKATQRSLSAQSRRKKWGTRDNIFYKSKSGKITNMSNYTASQFHSAYSKILGGKSSGSSGGSGGGSYSSSLANKMTQISRRAENSLKAESSLSKNNQVPSLETLDKKELVKILSQALLRQGKGGH